MEKLTIIKLGGSVVTNKKIASTARENVILRLGREIREAQKRYNGKILIGHGGGSFSHPPAAKYQTYKGLINDSSIRGVVLTSEAAIQFNYIVIKNFVKVGLPVSTFAPASFLMTKDAKISRVFPGPVLQALKIGLIPVFYGDVVTDSSQGVAIVSTEMIISSLLKYLVRDYKIERIIYCTDVDGVYDAEGKTIKRITRKNFDKIKKDIGTSSGTDVTGGMLHKVEESIKLSNKYSVPIIIINANKDGILKKVFKGKDVGETLIS